MRMGGGDLGPTPYDLLLAGRDREELDRLARNAGARAFYERNGFRIVARRRRREVAQRNDEFGH